MTDLILACVFLTAPPTQIETLEAMWRSQREEVVSARIRFRLLQSGEGFAPLGPDQVAAAFTASGMGSNPDGMQLFVKAIRPPGWSGKPWVELEFLKEGKKTRERTADGKSHDYVYDGELLLTTQNAGQQITVTDAKESSKIGRFSFDFFRPLPSIGPNPRVIDATSQRIRLATDGVECAVDSKTGLIESEVESSGGVVRRQILTAGHVTYPGGVTMASAVAVLEYSNGKLKIAKVAAVEEAEFNVTLPENAFQMAATSGMVIVDARYPDRQPKVAGGAIRDVAGRLRAETVQPTVPLSQPRGGQRDVYVYIVIGAVLLAIVVWVGRRWYVRSNRVTRA